MNTTQINISFSNAWINKELQDGYDKRAFNESFESTWATPDEIVAHVSNGKALAVGSYHGRRGKQHFISAQLIGLDFDDEAQVSVQDALQNPFIAQHAFFVGPTASHTEEAPRTRVLFSLDRPITDAQQYERYVHALLNIPAIKALKPDAKCKDAARLFFGSTQPGYHVNAEAVLDADLLDAVAANLEAERQKHAKPQIKHEQPANSAIERRRSAWAEKVIQGTLDNIATAAAGGRNNSLFVGAARLYNIANDLPEYLSWGEVEALALGAAPIAHDFTESEARAAIRSAARAERRRVDLPLWWNDTSTPIKRRKSETDEGVPMSEWARPVELTPFTATLTVDLPYISDIEAALLADADTICIKSPIGTGKTELIKRLIQRLPENAKVLGLTHRVNLARTMAKRLGLELYDDLKDFALAQSCSAGTYLRDAQRVVCSYDSLHYLDVREFDLLVIDEIDQFHDHGLFGGTMRNGAETVAYLKLLGLVGQARCVVTLDAHHSDVSAQWAEHVRNSSALKIENQHQRDRGDLTLYADKHKLIGHALKTATEPETQGVLAVAVDSIKLSYQLEQLFSHALGPAAVQVINSDNSGSAAARRLIQDAVAGQWPEGLRVFIYSPSVDTGVDIQAPVQAVYGIFGNPGMTPAHYAQMLGRCRHAEGRAAYVRIVQRHDETDASALYRRYLASAQGTATYLNFDGQGIETASAGVKRAAGLAARCQADKNRQNNDPYSTFVALMGAQGYTLQYEERQDKHTRDALKAIREAQAEAQRQLALSLDAIDTSTYELHKRNGSITLEIRSGHLRHKIEQTVGHVITPELYADLHTGKGRAALRAFTDIIDGSGRKQERDRQQAMNEVLLHHRGHYSKRARLADEIICEVFGPFWDLDGATLDLSAAEIREKMTTVGAKYLRDIQLYLDDGRDDLSQDPIALLRRVLSRVGLTLKSKQVMRAGKRFMLYSLDEERLALMLERAEMRLRWLALLESGGDAQLLQTRIDTTASRDCRREQPTPAATALMAPIPSG